ncbi:hypothetical protein Glove_423g23 [Diversispora epigaea]|uniref:SGF29 C-terminal domain-containing protein n=1 Tax=Diversispora epigaea TaxID=1348612 RepID=A0A397GVX9_9GLOM|nr:hypothetical protein Glove_423g23 [Diversispora epigaea]
MYITDYNNYNNDSDTSSRFSEEHDQLDLLTTRINKNLEKISNLQDSGLELLISVNQRHGPINKTCRVVPEVRDQINVVLEKAIEPSIKLGKKISNDIDRVLSIMSQSDDVYKRWSRKRDHETTEVGKNDEKREKYQIKRIKVDDIIKKGTIVAAKAPKSFDPDENWILAKIVNYRADIKKYEVEDADEEAKGPGERFKVEAKNIIRIPINSSNNNNNHHNHTNNNHLKEMQELPEFPVSHLVYALYPKTTCFYKASVVVPPSKLKSRSKSKSQLNRYLLAFEEDDNALRYVDALYVLDISEHKA